MIPPIHMYDPHMTPLRDIFTHIIKQEKLFGDFNFFSSTNLCDLRMKMAINVW